MLSRSFLFCFVLTLDCILYNLLGNVLICNIFLTCSVSLLFFVNFCLVIWFLKGIYLFTYLQAVHIGKNQVIYKSLGYRMKTGRR